MQSHTESLVRYCEALQATDYIVQLVHAQGCRPPRRISYTADQLVRAAGFLAARNAEGFHIYGRPEGWEYVLLDDIKRSRLEEAAALRPCLLLETSPSNFQLWLKLSERPPSYEQARAVCYQLAIQLEGDTASADPVHVGRLPGYTNRKPKYLQEGFYPIVKLHKSEHRTATVSTEWPPLAQNTETARHRVVPTQKEGVDRSRQDFNTACMLIRQRKSDEYIFAHLKVHSQKAQERGDSYIWFTIRNARNMLGISPK